MGWEGGASGPGPVRFAKDRNKAFAAASPPMPAPTTIACRPSNPGIPIPRQGRSLAIHLNHDRRAVLDPRERRLGLTCPRLVKLCRVVRVGLCNRMADGNVGARLHSRSFLELRLAERRTRQSARRAA